MVGMPEAVGPPEEMGRALQMSMDPGHDADCMHYEWGPCTCGGVVTKDRDAVVAEERAKLRKHWWSRG